MEDRSQLNDDFASAFHGIEAVGALELLDLSDHQRSELGAGVPALAEPIRAACQVVLDAWEQLDVATRTAALLVLANALADASDGKRGPGGSK